jgi:UDP-glucose 6-dehydrogenase
MIGIIGYGFVGKAVAAGFSKTTHIICDPAYNTNSVADVCRATPAAIFVCLPTNEGDPGYTTLVNCLNEIRASGYAGITVVKSTILPKYIMDYNIVLNPEFLSRATAIHDFINPPFVLFGGDPELTMRLHEIYNQYSTVNMSLVKHTDIKTASLAKYTFNSFYATKVTFMNQIYDVCEQLGVEYAELKGVLQCWPWMTGTSHLDVPGHEGRGFAGPCLPKDTAALANEFNLELLQTVLKINKQYRL